MSRRIPRFYCPAMTKPEAGALVPLPEGETRHLTHALRMGPGATVTVFDGDGAVWRAEVAEVRPGVAVVRLTAPLEMGDGPVDPNPRLHVAVSLLKRRAMDWMIEKLCELDVASLQPLVCERTVVSPREDGEGAHERWDRIALAAAKQSGRAAPMTFHGPLRLDDWLARERPPALECFAHTDGETIGLGEWLGERAGMGLPVQVAIGPEGGWSPAEVERFDAAHFRRVGLGPLVLRAETAAITVAAACRVML